jgi:stage IV sporulation protein B
LIKNRRKLLGLLLSAMILVFVSTPQFKDYMSFPKQIKVIQGEAHNLEFIFPLNITVHSDRGGILKINGCILDTPISINKGIPIAIESLQQGKTKLQFKLFGVIPVKKMTVEVLPQVQIIPGGHSIGVKLRSQGVIVIGFSKVNNYGNQISPAEKAGLKIGDSIIEINGNKVLNVEHVSQIINDSGDKPLKVKFKRNSVVKQVTINPVLNTEENLFQIGLWIRDLAAGVGTLTFYEPKNGVYGALGHIITDIDTGKPIELGEGEIIKARVAAIQKGKKNQPGEKKGIFIEEDEVIGDITKNTDFGIYGTLKQDIQNPIYAKTVPVALVSQVKPGPAEILTVVENDKIEKFKIEILKIYPQTLPKEKGLILKITDNRLLKKTGGIVQGMSGSPILQNNKLIGAVTHVFVSDPTKGYGVFAEWMIQSAQMVEEQKVVNN